MQVRILEVLPDRVANSSPRSVARRVRFSSEAGAGTAILIASSEERLKLPELDIEFSCDGIMDFRRLRADEPFVPGLTETTPGSYSFAGEITRVPVKAPDVIDEYYEASVAGEPLGFCVEDVGGVQVHEGDKVKFEVMGLQLCDTGH